jgi:hypothetical protein
VFFDQGAQLGTSARAGTSGVTRCPSPRLSQGERLRDGSVLP